MKLVVAVSGGVDSVVLLHALVQGSLAELDPDLGGLPPSPQLVVAHFHHGMHAQASEHESFVRELACRFGLPFHSARASRSITSEASARTERYKFLRSVRQEVAADWIVTAHHSDDQAETILLNLLRGAGLAGLAGMAIRSCGVWRPLLTTPKSRLLDYAKHHKLKWVTDPTNADPKYARNFLRLELWPRLQQLNPKFDSALLRTSTQARAAQDFLKICARDWLAAQAKPGVLPLANFAALSEALASAVLLEIYRTACGHTQSIEEVHLSEILQLAKNPAGNKRKKIGLLEFFTSRSLGQRVLRWSLINPRD